jgi:hypothetical protein
LLFFFFGACQNKEKRKEDEVDHSAELQPKSVRHEADIYYYVAVVNDLRIRNAPGKTGNVVGKVSSGDLLIGRNEKSPEKYHANFRDIPYFEPYLQINQVRDEKIDGWIFAGGVQLVYRDQQILDRTEGLSRFTRFIGSLDPKSIEAGEHIYAYLQEFASDFQTSADVDAAYIMTDRFLQLQTRSLWSYTEELNWSDDDMRKVYEHTFSMDKNSITSQLDKSGFRLETSEGLIYPIVNSKKVKNSMPGRLSPAMQSFIKLKEIEEDSPPLADAAIRIDLSEVSERAIAWERFTNQHPNFVLLDVSNDKFKEYLQFLLVGSSNTMAFDYDTKEIYQHVKEAWDHVLTHFPNSNLAKHIEKANEVLEQNHGIKTEAYDAFIRKSLQ